MNTDDWTKAEAYLNEYARHPIGKQFGILIHYWGMNPHHLDNPVHKHSFFEICYVIRGVGTYMDHEENYPLAKGTLFISRPHVSHQIRSQSGLELVYVAFEIDPVNAPERIQLLFQPLTLTHRFILHEQDNTPTALMWKALMMQATDAFATYTEIIHTLAYPILMSFIPLFSDEPQPIIRTMQRNTTNLMYRAKMFIGDNLALPLKLDHVAAYLHVSGRHLSRLFAAELNTTFTNYVQTERTQYASRLLRTTDIPVKQIAEKSGFRSVHYFTRVFVTQCKQTPGAYRRMYGYKY